MIFDLALLFTTVRVVLWAAGEGGEPSDEIMQQREEIQYGRNADKRAVERGGGSRGDPRRPSRAYEKWKGLIAEHGDDRETFRQLLWDEVYSKVDPEAL